MRLHRSITSFMKITLNNYEVTSRMRSLIGVAELILEKSITIQISTFQSSSKTTRTLQTLKVLSLAAGEGSNDSLCGSILCFFDLVGRVWKRAWRGCRLCAASLSTGIKALCSRLWIPSNTLHHRPNNSHRAHPWQTLVRSPFSHLCSRLNRPFPHKRDAPVL